jgi:hypothetical protein
MLITESHGGDAAAFPNDNAAIDDDKLNGGLCDHNADTRWLPTSADSTFMLLLPTTISVSPIFCWAARRALSSAPPSVTNSTATALMATTNLAPGRMLFLISVGH